KPAGVDAYRLDVLATDMFGLADHLGGKVFQVVGHDWGAAVAWRMAELDPDRLRRMVAINAPHAALWLSAMREDPAQRRKSAYVRFFRLPWLPELLLKRGRHGVLARAFASSRRQEAFGADVLEAYRAAWGQSGALTGMLNWYRALFRQELRLPRP